VHLRLAEEVDQDLGDGPPPRPTGGRPRKAPTLAGEGSNERGRRDPGRPAGESWVRTAWREGTKGALVKEVARVRAYRTGARGKHLATEGWLIGERPTQGHGGDRKQYFAWGLDEFVRESSGWVTARGRVTGPR